MEDHYEAFFAIGKILLRDYKHRMEFPAGVGVGTNEVLFPLGNEVNITDVWKQYVDKVTNELIHKESFKDIPVLNHVVMMSLRILLTGRSKGPNVGQLLALLYDAPEFITPHEEENTIHKYNVVTLAERMKAVNEILNQMEKTISANRK